MPFNSFNFWLVFPFIFLIAWIIPSRMIRLRNLFLVLVSYVLYMNWSPSFALVLLGVTAVTYMGGIFLQSGNKRHLGLCIGLLGLLPLVVFKYYNFLNESVWSALEYAGVHFSLPGLNWAIPVGISFFTFQAVGYQLDVYRGRIEAERSFVDYALFVCFFPQITSGPISKADELLPQLKSARKFVYEQGRDGLKMLLWGMFLKLVIADRLGLIVDLIFTNYIHYSGMMCFFAAALYSIQIYCDFAGYSLMAIGIARLLGYDLVDNFRRPYFAASVTEFWRRWHISLTRWLTTHIYVAMGGNRCSKLRQYINIMVTFLVSGIWHGANWTFVVWGALHGVFQIVEKALFGNRLKAEIKGTTKVKFRFVRMAFTFVLVTFAWVIFRMPSLTDGLGFVTKIFGEFGKFSAEPLDTVAVLALGLGMPLLFGKELYEEYGNGRMTKRSLLKWCFWFVVAVEVVTIGVLDCGQFIYVNF